MPFQLIGASLPETAGLHLPIEAASRYSAQIVGTALGVALAWISCTPASAQETAPAPPQAGQPAKPEERPATAPQENVQPGGDISGVVKSGNLALPGVTVTAANTLTGKKAVTSTDVDGSYFLHVASNGRYVVRAELAAFAPLTKEVLINAANRAARVDLEMILLSRAEEAARMQQQQAAQGANGGFQRLSVTQTEGAGLGADLANATGGADANGSGALPSAGLGAESATESVSVSGNMQGADLSAMSSDAIRQRVQEFREQQGFGGGGGRFAEGGGFGGGGFGGGGAPIMIIGGGRGRFNINRPHGSLFYTIDDSALDAAPYSLTGQALKPGYAQNRFGGNLGGPLNIPKIYHGGDKTFFFVNYTGSRSENPFDAFSTVPTLAERGGDFSNAKIFSGPNAGSPVVILNPQTHLPFPGNMILQIDPAAAGLLNFIAKPNLPGDFQNFHFATSVNSHVDSVNLRLVHSFGGALMGGGRGGGARSGARNNLNVGFRFQNSGNNLANPFPSVGGRTSVRGFDINVGYVRSFGKVIHNARVDFNRNRITTQNLYAFSQDIAGTLGINGVSQNPFDFGLPNLSFTNFTTLRDINPLRRRDQTLALSDSLVYPHKKHTWRWGGDFRRIELNPQTDSNARGSFTFTGFNSGFDFADFLLGLPQSTAVQFGDNNFHFRGNSWDLFVQDEWRVRANLTLNLGLRYEYVSPYTEINNRLVNLDVAPGFTAVAPVLAGAAGPFTGPFPRTLVNPDRNNFAPRAAFAWKPLPNTVVRGGYGINYNTGAYAGMAQQLAFQPPFSVTATNIESPALPLTLTNGFPAAAPSTVTNNYAVNRNYRLGYVQVWNFDIQHQFTPTLFMNLDYTGTKGTHLDMVESPNRGPNGLLVPNVQSYLWEDSVGDSATHAGSVRVRKRLQGGVSVGGSYTYSKSIDNASSIGGGATVVAQNAFDLAAERGLSSFDQRQRFTADYLWELPFGHDRHWLRNSGVLRDLFGDWQWSGDWTIASGLPFTPRVLGDFTDVNRGTNGTLRADLTGQPISLSNPSVAEWFNILAFTRPAPSQFGDAARNIVTGPGTLLFNMGFTKVVPMGDVRVLEVRAQAGNIFNRPQFTSIDSVVNSPTFGRVLSAGSMRKIQLVTRFRF